ncbi:MAG TPA: hypothetical protein VLX92_16850 [Kofleriaceae bacterium]|nr:hypothetical protein [Kofleriaceae bacterium]
MFALAACSLYESSQDSIARKHGPDAGISPVDAPHHCGQPDAGSNYYPDAGCCFGLDAGSGWGVDAGSGYWPPPDAGYAVDAGSNWWEVDAR